MGTVISGVVLDLDDTLYLEKDYVQSGFRHVARFVEAVGVIDKTTAFDHLWEEFEAGRRGDAFDSLAARFPFAQKTAVADLVDQYRSHAPTIELMEPDAVASLVNLRLPLALISDGLATTQRAKMEALGVGSMFDVVALTGEWGREFWKPHPRSFEFVESELDLRGENLLYVADNPAKDFMAPNRRGWLSVRLRRPGQLHFGRLGDDEEKRARMEIASLGELIGWLSVEATAR
jgi:putative hydrolase of the HAD superfamily